MTLSAAGNLGIGTNSPSDKLEVYGGNLIVNDGTSKSRLRPSDLYMQQAGVIKAWLRADGDSYLNGGNVGIGTTSPASKLHVVGTDGTYQTRIGHSTQSLYLTVDGNNVDYKSSGNSAGSHSFSTGNTERMRIASNGNVGIGTTSPVKKLEVNGTFKATGDSSIDGTGNLLIRNQSATGCGITFVDNVWQSGIEHISGNLYFRTGGQVDKMTIKTNGNVGIGTTSPATLLDIRGAGTTSNPATSGTTPSTGTRFRIASSTGASAVIDFGISSSGRSWLQSTDRTDLGAEYPFLLNPNGGNVGIGTDSPSELLELKPGSGGDSKINIVNSSGTQKALIGYDNGNGGLINLYNESGTRNVVVRGYGDSYFNGGNFGIGTTSPQAKLDISTTGTGDSMIIRNNDASSSAAPVLMLLRDSASAANGDYLGQIKFKGNSDTGAERVYAKVTAKISDATNGAEDSLIETAVRNNGANLIVSRQTNTDLKLINGVGLEVDGNIQVNGSNDSADGLHLKDRTFVAFSDASSVVSRFRSSAAGVFQFQDGSYNTNIVLNTNGNSYLNGGNIGIGTTSPNAKLNVNGNVKIEGENELYLGGSGSVPNWEIKASGSDLVINDTGSNIGSVLFNNDEGIVLPRLTTTEINAISLPNTGLTVYNTTLNTLCFYNGSSWQKVSHTSM
jgi:hypothetical protein